MARRIVESGLSRRAMGATRRSPRGVCRHEGRNREPASPSWARACEHVGVCVVDDAGTRQVCDELIPAMRPGSRIAIHSTVHPNTVIDLAKQAAARGIAFIDAPVSGGGPAAAARTLTVMVGGDPEVIAAARPIFETFGGLDRARRRGRRRPDGEARQQCADGRAPRDRASRAEAAAPSAWIAGARARSSRSAAAAASASRSTRDCRIPFAFEHGAKLLAKDVRLLGEVLGTDPSFAPLRDVAMPFLDFVAEGRGSAQMSTRVSAQGDYMSFSIDQFRLDGKVAVVTGAGGRGNSIGRVVRAGPCERRGVRRRRRSERRRREEGCR